MTVVSFFSSVDGSFLSPQETRKKMVAAEMASIDFIIPIKLILCKCNQKNIIILNAMKSLKVLSLLFLACSLNGCIGVTFWAYHIGRSQTCQVKVNDKKINSYCELDPRFKIQELDVIEMGDDGIPVDYYATQTFRLEPYSSDTTIKVLHIEELK